MIARPPNPEESRTFYRQLSKEKIGGYIWGKAKRFNPYRFVNSPLVRRFFTQKVASLISADDKVLDVGCGSGVFLPVLSPLCGHLVGLDNSYEMLTENTKVMESFGLKNVFLVNSQAEALPFDDCEFDVVIMVDTLHHIFNIPDSLREIRRVLKKHGRILIFEPNKLNPLLSFLCLLDRNERGALSLGSMRAYRLLFREYFIVEKMEYNGLVLGPDSLLIRGIVNVLFAPVLKWFIGWQSPKIFMVIRRR